MPYAIRVKPRGHRGQRFSLKPVAFIASAVLLLLVQQQWQHPSAPSSPHTEVYIHSLPRLTVWQTSRVRPNKLIAHNRQFLPEGTQFRWLDNQAVEAMVRDISVELSQQKVVDDAIGAFRSLRPWAFRADLWRAMVLWMYGGLYLDDKIVLAAPLSSWVNLTADSLVRATLFAMLCHAIC